MRHLPLSLVARVLAILSLLPPALAKKPPVKVFLIAGDDSVEGFAYLQQLEELLANATFANSFQGEKFNHLRDEGRWVERDDVFVVYERERHKPLQQGRLNMRDYGGIYNETFGPEVELGHVLGNTFDEPVIIVKAGWERKSLGHDFLPPSADGFTGFQWVRAVDMVKYAIDNAHTIVGDRAYKHGRAELAGVVWWQGFGDLVHSNYRAAYRSNLEHLVKDLRRTFHQPHLPIIVGELGGTGDHASAWELGIRADQLSVCQLPALNRTTEYVETAKYVNDEMPRWSTNARYYGRGDTMIKIGNAFAEGLLRIIFSGDDFGETENELEAGYEKKEEDEEAGAGMVIVFALGLAVLVTAAVQRYRSTEKDASFKELVTSSVWHLVRLLRPKDDFRNSDEDDNDAAIAIEFGSLPSSDSPLYELDEVSSTEGDDQMT
jgi:alpha-galactosidase